MQTLKLTKKYETYPEYKDSGVEWLGMIPKDWSVEKLKSVSVLNNKTLPENTNPSFSFSYFDIGSVNENGENKPEEEITFEVSPSRARRVVCAGDSIIATVRTYLKAIAYFEKIETNTIVSTGFAVLTPSDKLYQKYLYYYLLSDKFINQIIARSKGVSYPSITPNDLKSLEISFPDKKEQIKITGYLDQKISLLDEAINKKQKLAELLKEKRMTVVNNTVTKGLNINIELTDSGQVLIGKIPSNWKIKKLKYLAKIIPSNVDKLTIEDEEIVQLCNYVDVYKNEKITSDLTEGFMVASATKNQIEKLTLTQDDVIITKDSETPDDIGIPTYIPETLKGIVCGYHLAVLRPFDISGEYLFQYIQSNSTKTQFFLSANGLTRYAIGIGDIGNLIVAVPPKEEQKMINQTLETQINLIDQALQRVGISVEKLKEFKISLISNTVTGKIKV